MSAIDLKINEVGIIKELIIENKMQRQRFMDLGFIPNQEIQLYTKLFGTYAFKVMGALYGLRKEDAEKIILL